MTAKTDIRVQHHSESIKRLNANRIVDGHYVINYKYKDHNDLEIQKWIKYAGTVNITANYLIGKTHSENYITIVETSYETDNPMTFYSEHQVIANELLLNKLCKENAIHHIDMNR